jgi:hypothetical protein
LLSSFAFWLSSFAAGGGSAFALAFAFAFVDAVCHTATEINFIQHPQKQRQNRLSSPETT